jgi:AI-2 transport protein TqsA
MTQPSESRHARDWWHDAGTLPRIAVFLVIIAASWFMLKELAVLLRPLLLAILFCYVILPLHKRIHKGRSETATIALMAGGVLGVCAVLGILVYGSILEFNEQLPRLSKRAEEWTQRLKGWSDESLPPWLSRGVDDAIRAETQGAQVVKDAGKSMLSIAADVLIEAVIVGLYVIFLLIEARRLSRRLENGFSTEQSKSIAATLQRINVSIASYLKAKVRSSFILAAPAMLILIVFGVKFAVIWGLLTFFCNFIPYVGTVVGCGSPLIFSFLDLPMGWQPFAVASLLIAVHAASSALVEPTILGRAVGLSPLVILISLTLWGLCWGLVGMFLAVPLTVTLKIVFANLEATKGIAQLLGDD